MNIANLNSTSDSAYIQKQQGLTLMQSLSLSKYLRIKRKKDIL